MVLEQRTDEGYRMFISKGLAYIPSKSSDRHPECPYNSKISNATHNLLSAKLHVDDAIKNSEPGKEKYYCKKDCNKVDCSFYLEN